MEPSGERQRLLADDHRPRYLFDSSLARKRKRRVQQFQCCLCVIFIVICIVFIIVIVSISINDPFYSIDNNTDTSVNSPSTSPTNTISTIAPSDVTNSSGTGNPQSLFVLLSTGFPLQDKDPDNLEEECDNETRWNEAMEYGKRMLKEKEEFEKNMTRLPVDTPSYRHQRIVATTERARNLSRTGFRKENALRHYVTEFRRELGAKNKGRGEEKGVVKICRKKNGINGGDSGNGDETENCQKFLKAECNRFDRFRSYNGSCNNLKNPEAFGAAFTPFRRALPPKYADGISLPRTGSNNSPLPSARTVSLVVHRPYFKDDAKFSVVLAVWGQFLDHDITATALSQGPNGSSISCCGSSGNSAGKDSHPECFPVILEAFDPFSRYNVTCMEFVRSAPAPGCCLSPREQLNQVTAYIDGSVVYGVEEDVVKRLRTMKGGRLEMYWTEDNRTLLPVSRALDDGCNREEENSKGRYCFLAGDARSNENLHLTSMHLIWARQHNLIAHQLSILNPHWNDERLFQESRKILAAQMQHITYKEFLPILFGPQVMEKFELTPLDSGYFTKYNDSVDPTIANSFATAAFRFAHSIIPGLMKFLANDTSSPEFVQLHTMLLDPFKLYQPGEMDRALRGAMDTSIEASDPYFTDELKEHLFESKPKKNGKKKYPRACALDLVSLNIQRGRDHGLQGYPKWREHCGLSRLSSFEKRPEDIDGGTWRNIETIYRNVEDIDLYTGALSEVPLNGSILGPTLTCLILDQFVRIKHGDRFWYENPGVFRESQLKEIKKTSLARIICDNSDGVESVQPLVMEKVREGNSLVPCGEIPGPDWEPWKETLSHVGVPSTELVARVKLSGKHG